MKKEDRGSFGDRKKLIANCYTNFSTSFFSSIVGLVRKKGFPFGTVTKHEFQG